MAAYQTMARMDENAFRVPDKMQSKVVRKPLCDVTNSTKPQVKGKALGDLTNSTKPQVKGKAPTKNATGLKTQAKKATGLKTQEKIQPKIGRKPLGDLTNTNKPAARERSSKNSCNKVKIHSEGFCHNHEECIKTQNQSMSMEYFLETVGLWTEDSRPVAATPKPHSSVSSSELKLETPLKFPDDEIEIAMWETPAPKSPEWNFEHKDADFSDFNLDGGFSYFDFKLKESPRKKDYFL